jgi:hypothetical protein
MKIRKVHTEVIVNNFIDTDSGEVLDIDMETKHHKIIVDDKESFFWTYLSVLSLIDDLDKVSFKVLFYCVFHCQWNTNMVALTKPVLKDMELKVGIQYQTARNSISKLKKLGILIDLGSATYRINPRYYWKGNSEDRLKTMKYVLELECPTC